MSSNSVAPSIALTEIPLDHPALNTPYNDDPTADAYALQKGFVRLEGNEIVLRDEIAERLPDSVFQRIGALLIQGETEIANQLAGCANIHNVHSHCENWRSEPGHDAETSTIWCGKIFCCPRCAESKWRLHLFLREYPYLYEHLLNSRISVLSFTIEEDGDVLNNLVEARHRFKKFTEQFQGDHGWEFVAGFSCEEDDDRIFQRTKFFAIHQGRKLPDQPTLQSMWKAIVGEGAVKVKLFDGKDGDKQHKGLLLAFSGMDEYWQTIHDLMDGHREVEIAIQARNTEALFMTYPYGTFRGFDARVERERIEAAKAEEKEAAKVAVCAEGHEHVIEPVKCRKCLRPMIMDRGLRMTRYELDRMEVSLTSHIKPVIYGRFSTQVSQATHDPPH